MSSSRVTVFAHLGLLSLGLSATVDVCAQTAPVAPSAEQAQSAAPAPVAPVVSAPKAAPSAPSATAVSTPPPARPGPTWAELTEAERDGLAPLAGIWPRLSEGQKLKWRAVVASQEFENPDNKAKFQERMKSWAQLSAAERAQARLNYAMINTVPVEERVRKWEAYRELPEEERQRLMQKQSRQVWGAATPMTPAPKDRMASLPTPPSADVKRMDRFHPHSVDPLTLLPK